MFDSTIDYLIAAVLLFGIASIISLILTRIMIFLLPKWGMVDKPDFKRHIHTVATPRGGGIAMAASFLGVATTFYLLFPSARGILPQIMRILLPLAILLPLGILDDKRGLGSGIKFIFQILAAGLAWYLGIRMTNLFGFELPPWGSCIITVFWIVALINAFNMIDGVDGLASGIACISAFCMAFIALTKGFQNVVCFLIIFIGSLVGFLYFNWHPAKVFMGDTGSMFIGYLLAVTGIGLNARLLSVASIGVPLLACGVPVLDICLAVWRRLFNPDAIKALEEGSPQNGNPPQIRHSFLQQLKLLLKRLGTADRQHLHHRFLGILNNNQAKAVQRIYIIAGAMGIIAILCALIPGRSRLLATTLLIGTFSVVISRLATLELWDSAETIFHNFHSARIGLLLSHVIHPIFDLCVITLSAYCANKGTALCIPSYLIEHITIVMVVMIFSRNYRIFWNYSVSDDYFRLLVTICIGFFLSWLVGGFMFGRLPGERYLAAAGVTIAVILAERLSLHYTRNAIIARRNNSQLTQGHVTVSTIIVGITPLARYYRDQLSTSFKHSEEERILGLVTADRRYLHSFCYGLKVLATFDTLEELYKKKPFQKVIVTAKLEQKATINLQQFCTAHNIRMTTFEI